MFASGDVVDDLRFHFAEKSGLFFCYLNLLLRKYRGVLVDSPSFLSYLIRAVIRVAQVRPTILPEFFSDSTLNQIRRVRDHLRSLIMENGGRAFPPNNMIRLAFDSMTQKLAITSRMN